MARSIHTTRRQLEDVKRDRYADADAQRELVRQLRQDLARKRLIKTRVDRYRRRADAPPPVDPATIPIRITDDGEHVHHPATADDLRAVMRRLPPGIADGVAEIVLCLGAANQRRDADGLEPDPFTGRLGREVLPGIYGGRILGTYWSEDASIQLNGFVHGPDLPERRVKQLLLKLQVLSTFVHELAHHHDFTARVARDRWLADDEPKLEAYAERMEATWTHAAVVPHVEDAFADEVAHLGAWMEAHGGVRFPLAALMPEHHVSADGAVSERAFFNQRTALELLLEDVAAGLDPLVTRVEFARQLHDTGEYVTRFEAAHRLGRPHDAGHFTTADLARLRRAAHTAWADRLVAAHGAYIADPPPV